MAERVRPTEPVRSVVCVFRRGCAYSQPGWWQSGPTGVRAVCDRRAEPCPARPPPGCCRLSARQRVFLPHGRARHCGRPSPLCQSTRPTCCVINARLIAGFSCGWPATACRHRLTLVRCQAGLSVYQHLLLGRETNPGADTTGPRLRAAPHPCLRNETGTGQS